MTWKPEDFGTPEDARAFLLWWTVALGELGTDRITVTWSGRETVCCS